MSPPTSHKLIVRDDGHMFVVSGNPSVGYTCRHATLETVSEHKRSWQAVTAAMEWEPGEPTEAERIEGEATIGLRVVGAPAVAWVREREGHHG